MDIPYLIAAFACLAAAIVNLYITKADRSRYALIKALIWLYLLSIYFTAFITTEIYILRAGILTIIGIVILALLCILDTLTNRRC
jgi:uncharacterized membrane-anchored protein